MRAAAPARARTWRTRNARTRLRAAVHMLPCSPAPAETSASRRFAPQVCRRSEIQRIASVSHCCLPPSCAAGSSAPLRVNRSAVLLCTWRAHTAFSQSVLTRRAPTACSHTAYAHLSAPPRLASPSLPHTLFFLRPRLDTASRPDHRASLGAAAGRALGYRPRLNCEVRGQLLPLDLGPASSSVGRARCAVLASHPLRRALSTSIPRTPAHNLRVRRTLSCLATSLVGAAPSRRSMPKSTMPDRRCRRRRQLSLPLCLLPPPRRLCVCDRREMRVGERTRHPPHQYSTVL